MLVHLRVLPMYMGVIPYHPHRYELWHRAPHVYGGDPNGQF